MLCGILGVSSKVLECPAVAPLLAVVCLPGTLGIVFNYGSRVLTAAELRTVRVGHAYCTKLWYFRNMHADKRNTQRGCGYGDSAGLIDMLG